MTDYDKQQAAARKRLRRQRRWLKRCAAAAVLASLATGASWGFAPTGLQGIFPQQPPSALSADGLPELPESWAAWRTATAAEVAEFYKLEGDAVAQRAKLDGLSKRLATIDKALGNSQYSAIYGALHQIRGPLSRRIELAKAALAALEVDPQAAKVAKVKATAASVAEALGALEKDLSSISGGGAWLPYLKADELKAAWGTPEADAAVAAAKVTKAKLAKRAELKDESQKAFLGRSGFVKLEAAVDAYLAAAAIQPQAVNVDALRGALGKLVAAAEAYEAAASTETAKGLRTAVADVNKASGDNGDLIGAAVNNLYLAPNVRLIASEGFASKLVSDSRVQQGQVSDYVLGASVGGWQTTSTTVKIDLKPATNAIRFDLVLNGTIQSNTAGSTDQATVYTSGYHTFNAAKPIVFDGDKFTTSPATIAVSANNTTTGIRTRMSGVPIFGGIAQRIASQEVASRRPQAEAIARARVEERVLPEFNSEVNKQFGDAGKRIEAELNAGLKAAGIFPDLRLFSSTDQSMTIATRVANDTELAGSTPSAQLLTPAGGARLLLHETAVNNTIARIGFDGKTMSEEELRHHVEGFLSKALAREFKFAPPNAGKPANYEADADEEDKVPAKIAFAKVDPLRVSFSNGQVILIIHAGLEREGKDSIPTQEIVVPLTIGVEGDQLVVTRGELEITGIDGNLSPIQRKVINSKIGAALPERKTSAKVKLPGSSRDVEAKITAVDAIDGWIAVSLQ